jgi:hypothetical protein
MEVNTATRCFLLGGALLAIGAFARFQPERVAPWRTEAWMEDALPLEIPGFSWVKSNGEKPKQTYSAPDREYEYLLPYGVVCRTFEKGDTMIDAVVIAGNDRDTFHDPYFCLPGQDWKITSSKEVLLPTKTRGSIPVSIIQLTSPQGNKQRAVFCYKGPTKFHPTQNSLYLDWFLTELKLEKPPEGAYYRFMTRKGEIPEKDLLEFAALYLDAANQISKGIL